MDDVRPAPPSQDPKVQAALQDYLERVDRGEVVDRDAFLAEHVEIADELRSFIGTSENLSQLAEPKNQDDSVKDAESSSSSLARRYA